MVGLKSILAKILRRINIYGEVGAIFITTASTNPATVFGGTWSKIEDKFLVGTGTLGLTYTVNASVNNASGPGGRNAVIPYHRHHYGQIWSTGSGGTYTCYKKTANRKFISATRTTQTVGSSATNANIPQYYAVYIWRRGTNTGTLTYNANGGSLGSVPATVSMTTAADTYITTYSPTPPTANPMKVNVILPEGYMQVSYIQSSGTQYIDTGYHFTTEASRIVADIMVTSNASAQTLFGDEEYYNSSNARYFSNILYGTSGTYSVYVGNGSQGNVTLGLNAIKKIDLETTTAKALTVKVDDTQVLNTTYSGTILTYANAYNGASNKGNIYIFANHGDATTNAIQNVGGMRVYSFKMYDNNTLVRNFVPCIRQDDGAVGLYDAVTKQFYGNVASTGNDFTYAYITEGYTVNFLGWSLTKESTEPQYFAGDTFKQAGVDPVSQTLYAIYEYIPQNFNIVLERNNPSGGGVAGGGSAFTITSTCTPVATPSSGYIFGGWYDNPYGRGLPYSTETTYSFTPSKNEIIYAMFFKENEINFSLILDNADNTYEATANEDMKWHEWCNSGYNIYALDYNDNGILYQDAYYIGTWSNGTFTPILPTDTISANTTYYISEIQPA